MTRPRRPRASFASPTGRSRGAFGLAHLVITHNIGVIENIADPVAVMQAGRIVAQGNSEAVLQRPQHEYTCTLLAAAA